MTAPALGRLALRRVELGGVERLSAQLEPLQKGRPHADHSHGERRRDRERDAEQHRTPVSGIESPRRLDAACGELHPFGMSQNLHHAGVFDCGVVLRQRRLRGAPRGGDVDADRGIGLGPDNLREVAGFARVLRRAARRAR